MLLRLRSCHNACEFTLFVLHHDCVAEREQFEELGDIFVFPGSDTGHQTVIHELELLVSVAVPFPVYRLT